MNIKLRNLLLIGSIIASVILSSCKKDNDSTNPSSEGTTTPTKPDVTGQTGSFVDGRDGKTYHYIGIGTQFWMTENLAYTGSDIQHIMDKNEWKNNRNYDAWCYLDNNDSLGQIYGVLYQWEAAKTACPEGWHLPSNDEWAELERYLKENGYSYDGVSGHLYIAKALATDYAWQESDKEGTIGNTDYQEMRNKSGFSALPGSSRRNDGLFFDVGGYCHWWSATESDTVYTYTRYLNYDYTKVFRLDFHKTNGFSIRCIKN